MFLEISIENLRIFELAVFKPAPGLNLVGGPNGTGKTTLLEAMHLIATGRSFRHRETNPMIREGYPYTQLVARVTDRAEQKHVIGMRRLPSGLMVRLDGRHNVRRSEILQLLPIHFIGSDPQRLLTGPPEQRRAFLDHGLFHVERGYLKLLQSYGRVLAQRNAALRRCTGDVKEVAEWDHQLTELGNQLTKSREWYAKALVDHMMSILQGWSIDCELSAAYRYGWPRDMDLSDALKRSLAKDQRQHFTSVGPHRADFVMTVRKVRSSKVLSRGQLKMVVLALYFAQAAIQSGSNSAVRVLLLDDLAAELDRNNRDKVLEAAIEFYPQIIATGLDIEDLLGTSSETATMFHVEHGQIVS